MSRERAAIGDEDQPLRADANKSSLLTGPVGVVDDPEQIVSGRCNTTVGRRSDAQAITLGVGQTEAESDVTLITVEAVSDGATPNDGDTTDLGRLWTVKLEGLRVADACWDIRQLRALRIGVVGRFEHLDPEFANRGRVALSRVLAGACGPHAPIGKQQRGGVVVASDGCRVDGGPTVRCCELARGPVDAWVIEFAFSDRTRIRRAAVDAAGDEDLAGG